MKCSYCGREAEWMDNAVIYGRSYGKSKMIWFCRPCDAWVGCHNNTKEPLGTFADKDLRTARIKAHAAFDVLWKSGVMKRKEAYKYLSEKMGRDMHVGQSDLATCNQIIKLCGGRNEGGEL